MADDRPADEPTPPPPPARRRAGSTRARLDRRTVAMCIAVAAVVAVISGIVAYGLAGSDDGTGLSRADTAPSTKFVRPDGSTTSLDDYRGQKLVVNFFASTCVPCRKEMPALEQVQREAGDEITVLGIAVQDDHAAAAALVKRTGVTYDIGLDDRGAVFNAAGGSLLPFTIFVAADGTIMERYAGALTAAKVRQKISANLLAGG